MNTSGRLASYACQGLMKGAQNSSTELIQTWVQLIMEGAKYYDEELGLDDPRIDKGCIMMLGEYLYTFRTYDRSYLGGNA
jgi:hypothetical protein